MTKRPPSRPPSRKPDADAFVMPPSGSEGATSTAPDEAGMQAGAAAAAEESAPAVANREELVALLGQLQGQGGISAADEGAILRNYDGLLSELRVEKQRLEAAYREQVEQEGQAAADAWLTEAATALGRRQGEQFRALFATIPALASPGQNTG